MIIVRLIILSFVFFVTLVTYGTAEIKSWVDDNGVRHFSNVDTSQKSGSVKTTEEFKSAKTENKKASTATKPNPPGKNGSSSTVVVAIVSRANKGGKRAHESQKFRMSQRQTCPLPP